MSYEQSLTLEIFLGRVAILFAHGEGINRVLCSEPNFRFFATENNHQTKHDGGRLDGRAFVDSEWGCKELEVFCCELRNVPHPNITHDIVGEDDGARSKSLEESVDLQRWIYPKL